MFQDGTPKCLLRAFCRHGGDLFGNAGQPLGLWPCTGGSVIMMCSLAEGLESSSPETGHRGPEAFHRFP